MPQLPQFPDLDGVAPLPHLGVIRAFGEDAANFLHNQLTQDVLLMKADQCHLGAFCNAKGRMRASFVYYKPNPNEVLLVCRRDLIAQTVKRLSMFVLRAKVKLTDATADFHLLGLAGKSLESVLSSIAQETSPPEISLNQAWRCITWASEQAHILTLYPAMEQPRALLLAASTPNLSAYPSMDVALWQLGEVMSGIAWVEQATFEAFVPQMLNYESVDGVNFKKGCYPGQEVVARSQFRGTLKRRAYVVQSDGAIAAGQEIFTSDATDQPCGLVAQVATLSDQTYAIVELQTTVVDEKKSLHVGTSAGLQLHVLPLPYVLRDDI
jgi:folate-binding protein YgfZ